MLYLFCSELVTISLHNFMQSLKAKTSLKHKFISEKVGPKSSSVLRKG